MESSKNKQAVAIVCGGEINNTEWLKQQLSCYQFIIAADSGYDKCIACGFTPQLIVGDLDSVTANIPDNINLLTFPSRKDKTDFMLCLEYCAGQGYDDISVFGAWGGRVDHSLGAIFSLLEISKFNIFPKLVTESSTAFITSKSCTITKNNGYVSLFALGDKLEGLTLKGFDYPLNDATLQCCSPLGVSNKIVSSVGEITFNKGNLLVIIQD